MILLSPGCLYRYKQKSALERYERILSKHGVKYIRMDELACCGMPLRFAGYTGDFVDVARKNAGLIHERGITEIITLCPECNRLFEKQYKLQAGLDKSIKVSFISSFILERTEGRTAGRGTATYQDPCYLGRRSGIYEQPRQLIGRLGYGLVEPEDTREQAGCCGGNVRDHDRELSEAVARTRVEQFRRTGAQFIVTNCPHCYVCLSGKGMPVRDMSELF